MPEQELERVAQVHMDLFVTRHMSEREVQREAQVRLVVFMMRHTSRCFKHVVCSRWWKSSDVMKAVSGYIT